MLDIEPYDLPSVVGKKYKKDFVLGGQLDVKRSRACTEALANLWTLHNLALMEINRIYHNSVEGTRESNPSVHDLQSKTRLAESLMLQIMDTRMGAMW